MFDSDSYNALLKFTIISSDFGNIQHVVGKRNALMEFGATENCDDLERYFKNGGADSDSIWFYCGGIIVLDSL